MERRDFLQFMMVCFAQPRLTDDIVKRMSNGSSAVLKTRPGDKGSVFLFLENWKTGTKALRQLDWNSYEFRDFSMPLTLPHSLVQDPIEKNVVYVFETFGSFARIDLATGAVVKVDHRDGKSMSYGHATFASTGELLCTEVDPSRSSGFITVRHPKTLERIGTLPSECGGAHQIAAMPGGRLTVCGVATDFGRGDKGAVAFADGETKKLVNRVELPSSVSHVIPIAKDEVIALGLKMTTAPIQPTYSQSSEKNMPDAARVAEFGFAPVYSVKLDGTYSEFPTGGVKDFFKFNFAFLKIPNSDLCVTSHLGSHHVIFWSGRKPVKVIETKYPTNMIASADGSEFMVVTDGKAKVFSTKTLDLAKTIAYDANVVGLAGYKR